MSDLTREDETAIRGRTQWTVGISALRRVGKLVHGFQDEDAFNRRASRIIVVLLGAAVLGALALFTFLPNALLTLFRALS